MPRVRRAQVKETRDDVPLVSLIGNPFLGRRSSKGGFFCGRPFCRGPSPGFRLSFVTGVRGKRSGSILKGTLFFVHAVCFTKRLHHVLWVHHDAWRKCYQRRNLQVQEHRNISSEGHTIVEKGVPKTFVSFPLLQYRRLNFGTARRLSKRESEPGRTVLQGLHRWRRFQTEPAVNVQWSSCRRCNSRNSGYPQLEKNLRSHS